MRERTVTSVCAASLGATAPGGEPGGMWPAWVGGPHRIAYREWGPPGDDTAVVCVHGLARNSHDFDVLAVALSAGRRVVCPDMPGRGGSDWLAVPSVDRGYNYAQYLLDVTTLIARLDVREVDWVGTSMGGLIGMLLAAQPGNPVRRLVLNDVAPVVPGAFLEFLTGYIGKDPSFASVAEVEAYLRTVYVGFGQLPDQAWRSLAEHGHRVREDGTLALAYDPQIGAALVPPFTDQILWPVYDAITCPVLLLRGAQSPLVSAEVAEEMSRRGPKATVVEVPGCGHAPSLMVQDQVAVVTQWLSQADSA